MSSPPKTVGLSNLHTHSNFCDGRDSVDILCEKAVSKGFVSLGFSSHAPLRERFGADTGWHMAQNRIEAYVEEVGKARRKWEGRLDVFLGLEVDFISGVMGPADKVYREMGLDYIIGSVHYIVPPKGAPFAVDHSAACLRRNIAQSYGGDGEAMVNAYWDAVEGMVKAGGFDIAGHLDLPRKYNGGGRGCRGLFFSAESAAYMERAGRVRDLIALQGCSVEFNTGAVNKGITEEAYPSRSIMRLLKEKEIPMVINSDAHKWEDLDGNFPLARDVLRESGYTQTQRLCRGEEPDSRPRWTAGEL